MASVLSSRLTASRLPRSTSSSPFTNQGAAQTQDWRGTQQQTSRGDEWARSIDGVVGDPLADAIQGVGLDVGADELSRDDLRRTFVTVLTRCLMSIVRSSRWNSTTVPIFFSADFEGFSVLPDVRLLRREAIAVHDGLVFGAHLTNELEADQCLLLIEQLLVVEIRQPVELPPDGLVLATVEAEGLRQEPGRLLFGRPTGRVDRYAGEQSINERAEPRVTLCHLLGRFRRLRRRP